MSIDAGIPGMAELAKIVLSEQNMLEHSSILARFCAISFPSPGITSDLDGIQFADENFCLNLEEFMASVDAFRIYSEITGTWKDLALSPERIYPLLMYIIANTIIDLTPAEVPNYYLEFAKKLRPSDCVITFNWDCMVERACDKAGIKWTYPKLIQHDSEMTAEIDSSCVVVIKMHGSVDWREYREGLEVVKTLHTRNDVPIIVSTTTELKKEMEMPHWPPGQFDGIPAEEPYIVPPSHFKSFPVSGLPGLLWTSAYRYLKSATRIEVIGYSLPITDYLPRWLLRLGMLWNDVTGENLVNGIIGYQRCGDEGVADDHESAAYFKNQLNEARLQGLFHDPYIIRDFWDRGAIPITVVDPGANTVEHYRRLIGYNIKHVSVTAVEYFS
jgi:hypothetical protein